MNQTFNIENYLGKENDNDIKKIKRETNYQQNGEKYDWVNYEIKLRREKPVADKIKQIKQKN